MKKLERKKGNSLLLFPDDYIVLDIETTDFDYFYGDIIEIHAEKYIGNKLVEVFSTLINPGFAIDNFNLDLTGISNEMLATAPSFKNIVDELAKFLGDHVVVAHNAHFDINFLYDAILNHKSYHMSNDFVDTLRISRRLIKDIENHKLLTLTKYFNLPEPTHRAEQDVLATRLLYEKLKEIYTADPTLLELVRKVRQVSRIDFSVITSNVDHIIDEDNYFFDKNICITGKMDVLTKKEAAQILANLGATNQNNVVGTTDILILGDLDYQQEKFGDKSNKHKKAESMQSKGHEIEIMTELTFLDLLKD